MPRARSQLAEVLRVVPLVGGHVGLPRGVARCHVWAPKSGALPLVGLHSAMRQGERGPRLARPFTARRRGARGASGMAYPILILQEAGAGPCP